VDIARERGFTSLSAILEPPSDLLPQISPSALEEIQEHFEAVVNYEARGIFKPESMLVADVGLLREVEKIWMPIPGMYGVRELFTVIHRNEFSLCSQRVSICGSKVTIWSQNHFVESWGGVGGPIILLQTVLFLSLRVGDTNARGTGSGNQFS